MRSQAMTTTAHQPFISPWAAYVEVWTAWKEPIAGFLMVVGLCWSYILTSILPVHWWMFIPVTMFAAWIRQRKYPQPWRAMLPLWLFALVFLFFTLYAISFAPMPEYGREKVRIFAMLATVAYLSARRQSPLTPELLRGMRGGFLLTVMIGLVVIYIKRDFYLEQQVLGMEQLKQSVALTALPLAMAMGVCGLIPQTSRPRSLFLGTAFLLGGAVLEVFIRSRFHAVVLCGFAALLILGPPWRNIFWRVLSCGILLALGLAVYVNVLPLMGDSFLYLTWLDPNSVAGRGPVWQLAVDGFWHHPMGQGIGSFSQVDFSFSYPHNVILEVAFELGILGLICMLAIYFTMIRRAWQLWVSPPHRVFAAMVLLVFLHMLKSGDISSVAFHWVYLYLFVVCTPLARSWPAEHGGVLRW